jgi:ATP-dependent DNA helicase DinG
MRAFFGPGGVLARAHAHYEFRPSQLEMAQAVESAFREKRHVMVEAGTGTGKTLAYLLPALLSGRRVVVSTGTKNLQEQLFQKDVPFLLETLAGRGISGLRVCYMKGRANYLCRQKLYDLERSPGLPMELDPQAATFRKIRAWDETTEMGDRSELAFLPEGSKNDGLWRQIDARRETCTGQRCPQYDRCFITNMHRRALEADLIIVNHHLLFADLSLKRTGIPGVSLLPSYSAVIFDEAHEVEEVAGQYFGVSVSNYRLDDLANDCEALFGKGTGTPELHSAIRRLEHNSELFFGLLAGPEGRIGFSEREEFRDEHGATCGNLFSALDGLHSALASLPAAEPDQPTAAREDAQRCLERTLELRSELEFLLESNNSNFVFWIERRGRGLFLQATPVDVSTLLEEHLFRDTDTVVMTSATLSVGGSMDFVRRRLGLRYARDFVLESPFDYGSQAILYLPHDLPDPRQPRFTDRASEEVIRLLEATQGRAFVLFTSYAQMDLVYAQVSGRVKFPLLVQGKAPKTALLDGFRSRPGAVLFATSSFWQGVDVPGEQLSCVIVDRLPFAVPTDPVVMARSRRIDEDGGNAFLDYQIPGAVLALKQGFGRLIRARTDRGVLALLDPRIRTKPYGGLFLESLPAYRVTSDLAEVERFMRKEMNVRSHR